jgi:hypothetical protein
MTTLTDEIKTFIVKGLACYDTPSQVAEAVKATFGIEVSRQQVYVYDPNCSQPPAQRWRDLHAATRQALLRELAEIGIAHRAVRLRRLDRLASRLERNSVAMALKCLEMAAKECGGMYENRRPTALQRAMPQAPAPQPPVPQPAETQHAVPVIAASRRAARQPARSEIPTPRAPAPARPARSPVPREAAAPVTAPPPPAATPQLPVPSLPGPSLSVPQPLAAPDPSAPPAPPLSRVDRYLAYVRDRHARDRAVAAEARLGGISDAAAPAGPDGLRGA